MCNCVRGISYNKYGVNMENKFNLEIEDFGLINEANIEINRINVVGGVNSSGKSTASKLLYCFLKANSLKREEYILAAILPTLNRFVSIMEHPDPYANADLTAKYTVDDDLDEIFYAYAEANTIFEKLSEANYFEIPDEILWEMDNEIRTYLFILKDMNEKNAYSFIVKSLFKNESLLDFEGKASFFNDSFISSVSYEKSERADFIQERASDLKSKNLSYDDFDEQFIYSTEGEFNFLKDIFYIDSISIFDLDFYINFKYENDGLFGYKEHVEYLLKQLNGTGENDNLSKEIIEKIDSVRNNIIKIIGGYVNKNALDFLMKKGYYFSPIDSDKRFNTNISSGIEQISIVEILLYNYKLLPGSFLIIDEPEVNLHPEWQIKFAEILVLLANELDINIYLNSHSPMFIEAISLYAQYYDLIDETNFYLTVKQENDMYNFKKIDSKDMGEVYENLTKPYDELDKLKAKILFKE